MWVEMLRQSRDGGWLARSGKDLPAPQLVIAFGPTDILKTPANTSSLMAQFPDAIQVGCSTGTIVEDQAMQDDGMLALAVGFHSTKVRLASQKIASAEDSEAAGLALGRELAAADLAGILVLSDGLAVNGSALVKGLSSAVGPKVAISGGLAGDGARFGETVVSIAGAAAPNMIAAVGLYGSNIRIAHGSAGGWDEFGPKRSITRSANNVLYELDGVPALDLYERYLGEEAAELPASGLLYPLKVWDPAAPESEVVRTILAIDREARSLTFAGDMPQGWNARLMRGTFYRLTEGATQAAQHAHDALAAAGAKPELCLFVSCVGRRLLMQQRTQDEVEAVAKVIGAGTPMAGFYSYGEIAPNNASGFCGLHNQTVTLTLLAEAA